MGIQQPAGVTGRIGNVIHYKVGEKFYSRAAPKKFKQTKATKRRASEFGRASGLACSIRTLLTPVIPEATDRKMQGRLVAVVFQWLSGTIAGVGDSIPEELGLFQFTETPKTVRERWRVAFKMTNPSPGQLEIEVPAFVPKESIVAPAGTLSVLCRIAVGACDLKSGLIHGCFSTQLNYDYNNAEVEQQTIPITLPAPTSSLILMGVSLEYQVMKDGRSRRNKIKAYMPAGIVEAIII